MLRVDTSTCCGTASSSPCNGVICLKAKNMVQRQSNPLLTRVNEAFVGKMLFFPKAVHPEP